jgi:hypothetical protein
MKLVQTQSVSSETIREGKCKINVTNVPAFSFGSNDLLLCDARSGSKGSESRYSRGDSTKTY